MQINKVGYLDIEVTPEEDEAWSLFLRKYENLKLPPVQTQIKTQTTDIEEEIYSDGLFGKSVRSL
jgi:hypothetical protein